MILAELLDKLGADYIGNGQDLNFDVVIDNNEVKPLAITAIRFDYPNYKIILQAIAPPYSTDNDFDNCPHTNDADCMQNHG